MKGNKDAYRDFLDLSLFQNLLHDIFLPGRAKLVLEHEIASSVEDTLSTLPKTSYQYFCVYFSIDTTKKKLTCVSQRPSSPTQPVQGE
jgi:hypothetical protein